MVKQVQVTIHRGRSFVTDIDMAKRALDELFGARVSPATIEPGGLAGDWLVNVSESLWTEVEAAGFAEEANNEFSIIIEATAR